MAYHSNGGYSGDERESRSGGDDHQENDLGDKPIYLLEHLATFTVNKETGIVYPADGMRRLLQLEKTTGIWSQKMQLCLDYQWVLIMDYETGNIIERFPASLIQEPTAFTSNDPMEMYNNILVFIVTGGSGSRSEMHIFQSQGVSAVHLVEDLKQLRNGKLVTQHREPIIITPMQMKSSAIIHQRGVNLVRGGGGIGQGESTGENSYAMSRDLSSAVSAGNGGGVRGVGIAGHETDSEIGCANDETSSTSSDKYERDVTVLNHCFDDIEKFIARLQHAAAASRELERRRRNRKSKKKDPGEGLLTLRTRPPHEKEFIDIFAKFKLSFNLLAKLKAHIHDPNAPELVHFLFTPLALIVEASSDTYFESQLPVRAVNPLLTREAINLLINCVTSKETELWRSLGDAWTVPRDQWKEDIGSYHPVFLDGWSPDYLVIDELDNLATSTNIKRRIESHHNFGNISSLNGSGAIMSDDFDYDSPQGGINEKYRLPLHHHQQSENIGIGSEVDRSDRGDRDIKDISARSDISLDSIERNCGATAPSARHNSAEGTVLNGTHAHLNSTTGAQNAVIHSITGGMQNLYSRSGSNGGGFSTSKSGSNFATAEDLGVSSVVRAGASGGSGGTSAAGGVPHGDDQMVETWLDELQASGAKIVLVTYPRTANNDKELSVVRGEYLEILDDSRKWWKARNSRAQVAHVPHTIVTPYNYNDQFFSRNNKSKSRLITDSSSQFSSGHPQRSAEWVRNKHIDFQSLTSSVVRYAVPSNRSRQSEMQLRQMYNQPVSNSICKEMQISHSYANFINKEQYCSNILTNPPQPPPLPAYAAGSSNHSSNSVSVLSNLNQTNNTKNYNTATIRSTSTPHNDFVPQNATDVMQEELKQVLRSRERPDIDILKTPKIYIEQSSTPIEVETWLRGKEFSEKIIKRLCKFSGEELFALPPEKLEEYFGLKEGRRLASQIMLQKSVSGYKTARTTELQAVLAKARPKSELDKISESESKNSEK